MVSRILKFFNRASSSINEAALLLGLFTFISQLLGLVRDRLLATYVGAGVELDVYYAAFKIPDFLYVSVATLAALTVLLPFLSLKYGNGNEQGNHDAKRFLDQIFTVLLLFLVGTNLVLFIILPWIAPLLVPGFSAEARELLVMISRIMLVQPVIIGVSNLFSSVTQMFRKFFITALTPVMYNLGIILGIVIFYPIFGVTGLAYGVILGAVFHLAVQIPVLINQGFVPRITQHIVWSEIKQVVTTSIPRTLALSLSSFTLIVLTAIASTLPAGSITLFSLTNNILNVPIAIIGISYSVASFPALVNFFQQGNRAAFTQHITYAMRKIIFWSIPVVVLFVVLRAQIVRVIFGTQSLSWNDTRLAAASLAIFVLGLVFQSLIHLFVRSYYAAGNTRRPLITASISQVVIIGSVFAFLALFAHNASFNQTIAELLRLEGIPSLALLALPMAFALGNSVNAILLWYFMHKDFTIPQSFPLIRSAIQTVVASLCMGAVTYGALNILVLIFRQNTFLGILGQGFFAGVGGITIFVTVLLMVGNEDMIEFMRTIKRKFWKTDIVAMEQVGIDK